MSNSLKNLIAAIAVFLIGFAVAKLTIKPIIKEKTEYIPGETIHNSIPKPFPVTTVIKPKIDTGGLIKYCVDHQLYTYLMPVTVVENIQYMKVDTAKILEDFLTFKNYKFKAFDNDTLGTFEADLDIQYNDLQKFRYNFTPVQKVTTKTVYKKKTFEPVIGIGTDLNKKFSGAIGAYFGEHYGVMYVPRYDFNTKKMSNEIMLNYKF